MITVVWDVDDVLNDLMRTWLKFGWAESSRRPKVGFNQIIQNPPNKILGCSLNAYLDSLDQFRLSGAYLKLRPDPKILGWFKKHGDKARHIALTAVPAKAAHISAGWVLKNFGKWVRSFAFVPSKRPDDNHSHFLTKADYLAWLGKADVLVEDNPFNIEEAGKMGIKGLLLKKPWNESRLDTDGALEQLTKLIIKKGLR